jgi:hypothetical protein
LARKSTYCRRTNAGNPNDGPEIFKLKLAVQIQSFRFDVSFEVPEPGAAGYFRKRDDEQALIDSISLGN